MDSENTLWKKIATAMGASPSVGDSKATLLDKIRQIVGG